MRKAISLVLLTVLPGVACVAAAPAPRVPPGFEDVARVHRARCGSCHVRVEPGQRSRMEFAAALERHHDRIRMSGDDWAKMIDYLAPRDGARVGGVEGDGVSAPR